MHPYRRLRMAMATAPGTSACAACRVLRRKCTAQCLFAPYFPPDQPQKFAHVHKVFGVANVTKMLHELPPPHREDCVNSLAYEADARVQDPVYGCVGAISVLQQQANAWERKERDSDGVEEADRQRKGRMRRILNAGGASQVAHLQAQLALATSEIARLRETFAIAAAASTSTANAAASGALFMAALQPRSPSQADNTTPSTGLQPAATPQQPQPPQPQPQPQPLQQQPPPACVTSRQPLSPTPFEHSPHNLLL